MTALPCRRGTAAALVMLLCLLTPALAVSCPFCMEEKGPTLVGDFQQAHLVLLGTFSNARFDNKGGLEGGKTDFTIEVRFKEHEVVKNKKVITLDRYLPNAKNKFLIFCDVYKGSIDAYRGVEVTENSDLAKYLTEAIKLEKATPGERLRHCFDYLQSTDADVSLDAYREYAKADYADYRDMARTLPAEKIAGWLKDPNTPPYRYGLYASLLGLAGEKEPKKYGDLLKAMIDDPQKRASSGIDGLLASYLMLQPKEGWGYLKGLLGDSKQDFLTRYAALRTVRFFWDSRRDVFEKNFDKKEGEMIEGLCLLLAQPDIGDFAVEDLRRWGRWEKTAAVLDLFTKETHQIPVMRRSILRFAIQASKEKSNPAAAAFVEEQRRRDAEWVRDAEELLQLEQPALPDPKVEKK